jgi:hypothetical protein
MNSIIPADFKLGCRKHTEGCVKNEGGPSLRAAEASDQVDYFGGRIRGSPWPML